MDYGICLHGFTMLCLHQSNRLGLTVSLMNERIGEVHMALSCRVTQLYSKCIVENILISNYLKEYLYIIFTTDFYDFTSSYGTQYVYDVGDFEARESWSPFGWVGNSYVWYCTEPLYHLPYLH